jgi:hypothetical protein
MTKKDFALQYGNGLRLTVFNISFVDLQGISGSGAQPLTLQDQDNPTKAFGFPQYSKILAITVKPTVTFAGGALSALSMSLGVTGAITRFTAAYTGLFSAVADTTLQETFGIASGQYSTIASVIATFTPTSDVLKNATAGNVEISILWADITSTPNGLLPA